MEQISPALITKLIAAIIMVESGGDNNKLGSCGEVGVLQIRPILVEDVNRLLDAPVFSLDDRSDPNAAKEMFRVYSAHYASTRRLGRIPTLEDIARNWNGGPNGYRKSCTNAYWAKVKEQLDLAE